MGYPSRKVLRKVFTTGEVARYCNASSSKAAQWIDHGLIKGYLLPGSQDRRVPRENLISFLEAHGMPLGDLAPSEPRAEGGA